MSDKGHLPKKIAVIGAGTMGNGIAQVFATLSSDPKEVILCDVSREALKKGENKIFESLEKLFSKGKINEAPSSILSRLTFVERLEEVSECELAIEAVPENLPLKKKIFTELDKILHPSALIASNTSSISLTELSQATKRADRVIGMHFMNPVPLMKLVEIIRGLHTSDETLASITKLTLELDKTPVEVKDFPGFVSNRVLMPLINEAIFCLYEGVATKEAIDTVLKLGMNHPMGPLALADLIGLDTCLSILEVLYQGFKDPKYRPCPLLVQLVNGGCLGKKTGQGFYSY